MTAPLDVTGTATEAQPEAGLTGLGVKAIEGRSLGQIAWTRLKRDKVAIIGGVFVLFLILVAVFGSFVAAYGLQNTIDMIDGALARSA